MTTFATLEDLVLHTTGARRVIVEEDCTPCNGRGHFILRAYGAYEETATCHNCDGLGTRTVMSGYQLDE